MDTKIKTMLTRVEQEHQVRILFAVESGSRGWGFEAQDSDYDVRFVYCHAPEWYLSIEEKRDVIEYPLTDNIDLSGWDIKKALGLFYKSNPPMLEWLRSPILYKDDGIFANKLRELSQEYFSPKSCMHHYLSMAKGNYKDYFTGESVKLKKYFYTLRPILACKWIEQNQSPAPMVFTELLELIKDNQPLYSTIIELVDRKKQGDELDTQPKIPVIQDFIVAELARVEKVALEMRQFTYMPLEILNSLFRKTIGIAS